MVFCLLSVMLGKVRRSLSGVQYLGIIEIFESVHVLGVLLGMPSVTITSISVNAIYNREFTFPRRTTTSKD